MATAVSICSNALILLGESSISAFDEGSDNARQCANIYPYLRDSLMRKYQWSCCIKRVQLAPIDDAPVFGFSYAYTIPGECLLVLSIDSDIYPFDHKVEGQQILANIKPLYLRYVFRNEVVESWDAGLVDVMHSVMCAALAYPVTRDKNLKALYDAEVKDKLRAVRAVDSQQNTNEGIISSPLIEVRGI